MADEHYLGNPLLKKANTKIEFTEDQVLEWIKCAEDPVYFAKKYIKITTLDYGLSSFDMYPFQETMVDTFHKNRFTICKLPRQSGKCFSINTMVKIRNKDTGEILEIPIGELYDKIQKENNSNLP
jgi:hypothetical protein